MKKLMIMIGLVACFVLSANAAHSATSTYDWTACSTGGKTVPTTLAAGDIGTLPFPTGRNYVAFFTTQVEPLILGDLRGKTITATFRLDNPSGGAYGIGGGTFGTGQTPSIRLYFTTATGNFNFNDSDSKHPSNYWWNGPSSISCDAADGFTSVTITATLSTTGGWSDSHGGSDPTLFLAAAANVHQIGFGFGGTQFFDIGVNGPATMHLLSYTVQ